MRLVKKTMASLLAFILFLSTLGGATAALAAEAQEEDVTVLQNDFIKITVDNNTGRFGIRTVEGQPIRKKDDNVPLMFRGDDPETSFTTFRIDGTDYIFGNPYKFGADFFSEITKPVIVNNPDGSKQIETVWTIKGVQIKQILMLYPNTDQMNAGNVNIRYQVVNRGSADVKVGTRILLDTMVGSNDGPLFQIGTSYRVPLSVERKLIHDPENDPNISFEDRALYKLPPYWVMRDSYDLTNPLATNVIAYGFNNFAEDNINIVDEMIVGHWNGLANTKWDYEPNPNLDFTRDTNDYGTADSAVAFYWYEDTIPAGGFHSFETVYGLGEIVEPDKVFSIRFLDPVQQMATLSDNSGYENEGVFDIIAEIENLAMYDMEHSKIEAELTLENNLNFVRLDESGNVVRDENGNVVTESVRSKKLEFRKPATPEEASQGIEPKYQPGDTITVSFKVQAKGKPWPTTRQYMLTARSPETQREIEGLEDEGIKAQYESSKSNFVLLPAIGEATPTYVFGLSPSEVYYADEKFITLNISNLEAYNTGSETSEPNFDLYFREVMTGKRYKVPVKESVLLQTTDDGFTGDMKITYRGGDRVDENGDVLEAGLGPELPFGEYQVEIDFTGDAGGDEELAALFDITTSQTFKVTNNEQTRVREANLLAVYKQYVDLSHVTPSLSGDLLEKINSAFPGEPFKNGTDLYSAVIVYEDAKRYVGAASKAVDPKFDLAEFLSRDALEETPAYNYKIFASEEEMDEFFEEDEGRELLVKISGMIKQVGTGDEQETFVDTSTEPAIINDAVAYKGKNMIFTRGKLDIFNINRNVNNYDTMPFFDSLIVSGDGTLSVASSGFIFHKGEWSLDFYNGFEKTLGEGYVIEEDFLKDDGNEEDDSLNGTLSWAVGALGDRLNPMRQLMIEHVYFNKHSLFSPSLFSISGFGFTFNDFILRPGGISFGGSISFKVIEAEVRNVIFNDKGFVGVDASLKFDLNEELGLFEPADKEEDEDEDPDSPSGEIYVVHYVQDVEGVNNMYGMKFSAQLKNMLKIRAELAFKKVDDGRILPDVIAFGTSLPSPGYMVSAATYLTGIRGALRELADTIAGGTKNDPFPLVIQAGVDLRFGLAPAYHFGEIDLTLKRTGIALEGKLDFSTKADPDDDDLIPMLTHALIAAQWVTPWFVMAEAELDIGGWDIIIGEAGIFVGQNLEKNRIDFEGYIGATVQIPSSVPVVGGMPLSSVYFGLNNDKIWGGLKVLVISLGITYYWGGGVEFGTSGEGLPEGMVHLLIEDPERGPQLVVIGQGVQTLATSWISAEEEHQGIVYREIADGVTQIDTGNMSVGIGGIRTSNGGRTHQIPMDGVSGHAMIEITYDQAEVPSFTLTDGEGKYYPVVFDNTLTDPNANAYVQHIPASENPEGVDIRRAYVIIPAERLSEGGVWTLNAESSVETRLLSVPTASELKEIKLENHEEDPNKFTASWSVDHPHAGDVISLYLTQDAVGTGTTTLDNGQEVLDAGSPGLIIAKDLPVDLNGAMDDKTAYGKTEIDVTQVSLLGGVEDIRGLIAQGDYYLRAELKSASNFNTMTSAEKFKLIDPLAPKEVSDVIIEPAGNGLFRLSFKPAAKKAGHENFEHSYVIEALREQDGELKTYSNFGEQMFTEEELAPYWNPETGRYENILIGGWHAVTTSDEIDTTSLEGGGTVTEEIRYAGLEVGHEYVIGVRAVTKPDKAADKNENYHFSGRTDSAKKLLPVPSKPKLAAEGVTLDTAHYMELLTKETEQTIKLSADQPNVEVEAFYAEQSIGKVMLENKNGGSFGTLHFDQFQVDGPYAIELVATNTKTGDSSVKMLYLTVDTIAPVLYIDEPATGDRTANGSIAVKGSTTPGTILTVNGTTIPVQDDGNFQGTAKVVSDSPSAELLFVARDEAGNENRATVYVTNDDFQAPAALVLKKVPTLSPGDTAVVEAYLKIPDGKDDQGKAKFKEVKLEGEMKERIAFASSMGEAAEVTEDGRITAVSEGASLIEAEYEVSEGATLSAMTVVEVEWPEPTELGHLPITVSKLIRSSDMVKVSVESELQPGTQLVYKLFKGGRGAAKPEFREDLSGWSFLPQDGFISAEEGDKVVVAVRTSLEKLAVASSDIVTVEKSSKGYVGGGGGGPIGGTAGTTAPQATVNGKTVRITEHAGSIVVNVTASDAANSPEGDLVIAVSGDSAQGYTIRIDQAAVELALQEQRDIVIDSPLAQIRIPPEMLQGLNDRLEIAIGQSRDGNGAAAENSIRGLHAELLGGGHGVTIVSNIPEASWNRYVETFIPVPESIGADEITAVVLLGEGNQWTTLPWELAKGNGISLVLVRLTGSGRVVFVRHSKEFKDVPKEHWGSRSIHEAAAKLFVLGRGDERFDPDAEVNRAEYPTILLRAAGLMNKTGSGTFGDVTGQDWFAKSVAIAASLKMVNGRTDGTYAPYDKITRIEAMAMAGRLLEALQLSQDMSEEEARSLLGGFADAGEIPDWGIKYAALAVKYGIIVGEDGFIHPDQSLTRAQAAAIANRLEAFIKSK